MAWHQREWEDPTYVGHEGGGEGVGDRQKSWRCGSQNERGDKVGYKRTKDGTRRQRIGQRRKEMGTGKVERWRKR